MIVWEMNEWFVELNVLISLLKLEIVKNEMSEWISSVYSDYMLFVHNKQR